MIEITGQKFGLLTAVKRSDKIEYRKDTNKISARYWWFQCECGAMLERVPNNIKKNKYNACLNCKTGAKSHAWQGYGEMGQDIVNTIKHGAIARGYLFDVTGDYLWQLYLAQNRKCVLTGWPIEFNKTYRTKTSKTASLDRIDSTKGYIEGNLQWVHRDVNKLKKNLPDNRFIELCLAVAKHTTK